MNPKTRPHVQMIVLRSDLNRVGAVGGQVIAAGEPCWSMTSPWNRPSWTLQRRLAQFSGDRTRVTKALSLEAECAMERCLKGDSYCFCILPQKHPRNRSRNQVGHRTREHRPHAQPCQVV